MAQGYQVTVINEIRNEDVKLKENLQKGFSNASDVVVKTMIVLRTFQEQKNQFKY